jgi:hypothetical protein
MARLRVPVREEVADLSWEQRHHRLQTGGNLLSTQEVAARTLKSNPSRRDVIVESEREEQRLRDEQIHKMEAENEARSQGQKLLGSFADALRSVLNGPAGLFTLPLALVGLVKATEKLGEAQLESYRNLRRFNGTIANTFARLDRQRYMLEARQANATAGSTKFLGEQMQDLRESLQPLRSLAANVANLGLGALAKTISLGIKAWVETSPQVKAIFKLQELLEKRARQQGQNAYMDVWKDWATGRAVTPPKNPKPAQDPPKQGRL